ncbi:MAG: CheR family methyltransferase [Streptosporangiaceae bacterium]
MTSPRMEPGLDDLLLMLKETRGFDFTGYKPSTLQRRIHRRMAGLNLATFGEYRDYLELEPDEFTALFDSMLINVTGFFRDPAAWQTLSDKVIPELLSAKSARAPIRVWSAGCATGEEAYTLAIILAEALGPEQFRDRVKIYATDLDEEALHQARLGAYDEHALAEVPGNFREAYFEPLGTRHTFRRDLRRQVIFGRNDLTRDAPISRVDLLVSRNTLMYFNAETQASIVRRFHFALSYPGYLFLGKAEMLLNHSEYLQPVDLRSRIFRKASPIARLPGKPANWAESGSREPATGRLEDAALASVPVVQLATDLAGNLRVANAAAEALFNLRPRDLGRPFQDLEVSYRPVELRSRIEQVRTDLRPVELRDVEWRRPGGSPPGYYDVSIAPLFSAPGDLVGTGISFLDVTRYRAVRAELEHANSELERAYEELQSLNEELETTNEELQSTNEELETTNEELQSTNEELETMNEELQSTNDELQTINDELRRRTDDLDQTDDFLGMVLRSLGSAVIVLTDDLRVEVWSPGAEDMWGLRADETEGKSLLTLDIGLPAEVLAPHLRRLLGQGSDGTASLQLAAVNRRGKTVHLRIAACPLRTEEGAASGVILVIDHASAPGPRPEPRTAG